ncbi:prepropenicillopepsin [Blastomyces gilchristii SLH14081]|uniref:Prepropenicillopepsin n=1 Tax=Blastomyces gilchristii (strain SLH14081) TaxID=559298 RepID=A0A179UMB2_BLAGS|nr:prepropenicillopepsin [Blastomyces gilchristii SLH14081]OAT08151.1 prepropenicillopepsin [Blastomyces gilchristii SLH14081]
MFLVQTESGIFLLPKSPEPHFSHACFTKIMRCLGIVNIAAAFLFTLASSGSIEKRSGFSIQQVSKCRPTPRSPMEEYAVAILRADHANHAKPKGVLDIINDLLDIIMYERSVNQTVSATPEPYDNEYLSPVNVAGKIMNLALDTGSADLWVFSSQQPLVERASHDFYTPLPGKLPMNGSSWEVNYGDGSFASGNVYIDRVSINDVVSPSQSIQAAQKVGETFIVDSNLDGVLGLAFPSVNNVRPEKQLGFFDNVKDTLPEPLFAVSLKKNKPGTFDFGFIDDDKYNGNITYTPVYDSGFWSISTTGYAIGDSTSNTSTPIKAFLDTGTTLMLLPEPIINDYYSQIPGSAKISGLANAFFNGWMFPCNATIPPFSLIIENNYRATIPPEHIILRPLYGDGDTPMCFGSMQAAIHEVVFGDILFKSQYVVFDTVGPRVGFARQAQSQQKLEEHVVG